MGVGGFDAARVEGIPALFVIDAEHEVVAFIGGHGGHGDRRLEDALDQLLAETPR